MKQEKWTETKEALQKSISIQPSDEAYHNLAVAHYNLGELEKASEFFTSCRIRTISCIAM